MCRNFQLSEYPAALRPAVFKNLLISISLLHFDKQDFDLLIIDTHLVHYQNLHLPEHTQESNNQYKT